LDRASALRILELNESSAALIINCGILAMLFKKETKGCIASSGGGGIVESHTFGG
jgi:hypothetical protein